MISISPVGRGSHGKPVKLAAGAAALALALLSLHSAGAHKRITTAVAWDRDIRPIFEAKCMACHHPGGVAPTYVDLTTYGKGPSKSGGAWAWAAAIEEEVMTGRMPPWKADPRFGAFSNDRRLTPDERNTIVAWIQGGAPEGKRRGLPPPEGFDTSNWTLGPPAMEIKMPEEFVLAPGKRDGAYSFTFELPKDFGADAAGAPVRDRWITAVEFLPGAAQAVHTIIAFAHDPHDMAQDYEMVEVQKPYDPLATESEAEETRMRPMRMGAHFLGQWTRGDAPVFYPAEAARKLRAGSTIEVQVLYHKFGVEDLNVEFRDRSSLGLHFAASMTEFMVDSLPLQPEPFTIPADEPSFKVVASAEIGEAAHLMGISPLLGPLARSLEVTAAYPDGKRQLLLSLPEADFKWSASYQFSSPLAVPAGTRIELEGRLDNSPANRNNPNKPPKAIAPRQERFSAWLDYYPDEHRFIPTPTLTPAPLVTGENTGMLFGLPGEGEGEGDALSPSPTPIETASAPPPAAHETMKEEGMKPQRAGVVFPFGNEYHSVEVALPFADEFRVYLYDEYEKPVDPRNFAGKLTVETGADGRKENMGFNLEHREFGDAYLMARVPAIKTFPVHFEIKATIAGQTQDFQSKLEGLSRDPVAETMMMMEHMDHEPVHGGLFIMAEDLYHHLEGVLFAEDEFRLYYFGEMKRPLSPINFRARVVMETFDEATEEIKEQEFQLRMTAPDEPFAAAKIPPVKQFPVDFNVKVWMADKEYTFSFAFDRLTEFKEAPALPESGLSDGGIPTPIGTFVAHEHTRAPLVIPTKPEEMARELYKRDTQIRAIIDAKRLLDLYGPPMDAKELSDALKRAGVRSLESSKKRALVEACNKIGQGAVFIHEQGHQQNQALVEKQAYRLFAEGLAELKKIYPE